MPAASEGPARRDLAPTLPHTWRPLGPRIVGAVLGVGLLAMFAAAWFSFDDETQAKFTAFQIGTLFVLVGLGYACMFALVRSRVVAERDRLIVVNGYRRREYSWPQIVSVNLPPGAPWVTLDLADGTTAAVMGIQGSDGARAQAHARQLRALAAELPR
ncbi:MULTISPECIES: PH domain-containing protein [Nocardioides]|uniref:PH domain-containing protein n=1 Tax=Nocardioides kribbensis TaxID=305517 RepID=A0ABV1P3P8_9ACTN|nr:MULTISPECIES: PH domain-containing protein [unclassified Nocardioides]KQP67054.1 hypothetical protein ASF47_05115 [Nocardioides sp. Leaf285]MCM3513651.1 PH domain-containing protein [Nocardioides sp. P86]